jgi:hypothetical protein
MWLPFLADVHWTFTIPEKTPNENRNTQKDWIRLLSLPNLEFFHIAALYNLVRWLSKPLSSGDLTITNLLLILGESLRAKLKLSENIYFSCGFASLDEKTGPRCGLFADASLTLSLRK